MINPALTENDDHRECKIMRLSGPQISSNYQQAYSLAVELLKQLLQQRGYTRLESYDEEEICQSALGNISIVSLLTEKVFTPDSYRIPLMEAIEDSRRMLFPDVGKRRFTSIDKLELQQVLLKNQPDWWRSLKRISNGNNLSTWPLTEQPIQYLCCANTILRVYYRTFLLWMAVNLCLIMSSEMHFYSVTLVLSEDCRHTSLRLRLSIGVAYWCDF